MYQNNWLPPITPISLCWLKLSSKRFKDEHRLESFLASVLSPSITICTDLITVDSVQVASHSKYPGARRLFRPSLSCPNAQLFPYFPTISPADLDLSETEQFATISGMDKSILFCFSAIGLNPVLRVFIRWEKYKYSFVLVLIESCLNYSQLSHSDCEIPINQSAVSRVSASEYFKQPKNLFNKHAQDGFECNEILSVFAIANCSNYIWRIWYIFAIYTVFRISCIHGTDHLQVWSARCLRAVLINRFTWWVYRMQPIFL